MSVLPMDFMKQATKSVMSKIKTAGVLGAIKYHLLNNGIRTQGVFKGEDQFGNKYYQDGSDYNVYTRSRWVEYTKVTRKTEVNGANVPPEWHNWLHYTTNTTPVEEARSNPIYQVDHKETLMSNLGAEANYVPAGYIARPHDIKADVKIRPRAYERWDPAQGSKKKVTTY